MSDAEIDALLQAEGLESEGADALLEWARRRAAELIASTEGDAELGPLLREGGQVGADQRAPGRRRAKDEPARAKGRGKKRGRGRKRDDADEGASESEAAAPEAEAHEPESEPEWKATMHGDDPVEASPPTHDEEVTTPRGESSYAGPLPPVPRHAAAAEDEAADEIEEIDAEELEILDEEEPSEDAPSESEAPSEPDAPAVEAPTFGPPDGTDAVPAWRAALFAAETGSDREAAQLIQKEESGIKPMPVSHTEPVLGERLEAEEDEISQHKIDLSDLDGGSE
jgi:hypothetical protein